MSATTWKVGQRVAGPGDTTWVVVHYSRSPDGPRWTMVSDAFVDPEAEFPEIDSVSVVGQEPESLGFRITGDNTAEAEAAAARAENHRCVRVARGCTDYLGGYTGPDDAPLLNAFRHGIETVVRALAHPTKSDPQVRVLEAMGAFEEAREAASWNVQVADPVPLGLPLGDLHAAAAVLDVTASAVALAANVEVRFVAQVPVDTVASPAPVGWADRALAWVQGWFGTRPWRPT